MQTRILTLIIALASPFGRGADAEEAPDIRSVPTDLELPQMTSLAPAAGRRVKQTHPEYSETSVYHSIYLPSDYRPVSIDHVKKTKPYPVLIEFAGNGPYRSAHGDVSTGHVEGSKLGYGISAGKKFIWVCLPYLDEAGTKNVTSWWGDKPKHDPKPTVEYCKKVVPWICEKYGGDPTKVVLVGFSRGAIACNFIGLHDEEISKLWSAFVPYSHYDGVARWSYPGSDRNSALKRLKRLRGRPQFICHETGEGPRGLNATKSFIESTGIQGSFRFVSTGFRNHNDAWVLRPSPARKELRAWLDDVIEERARTRVSKASAFYFPSVAATGDKNWESVDPSSVSWSKEKLDAALDFAMDRKSSSVVILHRGRILAERHQTIERSLRYRRMAHGKTSAGHAIEDVASVQKSIVSVLVGIAQEKRLVDISKPVSRYLGSGWSQASPAQEAAISLEHLLSMSSGLNEKLEFVTRPARLWRYNTAAYSQSLRAIVKAAKRSRETITSEWLTKRIGMHDSKWVPRPWASENSAGANRVGFTSTARDLARFGLLVLAKGRWDGKAILEDQSYLAASLSPSQNLNRSYGYLWWINGQTTPRRVLKKAKGPLLPEAPADMRAALGALGRKCYVVPSLDLVVTRLGDTPDSLRQEKFDKRFWTLLMAAAPKTQ